VGAQNNRGPTESKVKEKVEKALGKGSGRGSSVNSERRRRRRDCGLGSRGGALSEVTFCEDLLERGMEKRELSGNQKESIGKHGKTRRRSLAN